jgi:hypothetical protein
LPPPYYKHDESQRAGTIESLGYDDNGNERDRYYGGRSSGYAD